MDYRVWRTESRFGEGGGAGSRLELGVRPLSQAGATGKSQDATPPSPPPVAVAGALHRVPSIR
jgi:hypothetical protein